MPTSPVLREMRTPRRRQRHLQPRIALPKLLIELLLLPSGRRMRPLQLLRPQRNQAGLLKKGFVSNADRSGILPDLSRSVFHWR